MQVRPGFNMSPTREPLGFSYGEGSFGPQSEQRSLDSIRASLRDPACVGPEWVYAISMDVGKAKHQALLKEKMLLFGAVTYATGSLGREPIRSQGHIHRVSSHSGWSPPEIYEIWEGQAVIYIQDKAEKNAGRCIAVHAGPGEVVVVPPGLVHATINADPTQPMTFGAWCDREYGFEYDALRGLKGIAYFPLLDQGGLAWEKNAAYEEAAPLLHKGPSDYSALGIEKGIPIYEQFEKDPERFQFVSQPQLKKDVWDGFVP